MACCLRTYRDRTISRWTVERHRDKMHLYMRETMKEKFARFVAEKAVVMQLSFDSTPMRLSATGLGNTKAVEVYVRHITARPADGEEMKYIPEVSAPANSPTAGVASTIMVEDLLSKNSHVAHAFARFLLTLTPYQRTKQPYAC